MPVASSDHAACCRTATTEQHFYTITQTNTNRQVCTCDYILFFFLQIHMYMYVCSVFFSCLKAAMSHTWARAAAVGQRGHSISYDSIVCFCDRSDYSTPTLGFRFHL
ncbi:unnamed protein product [Ceratitis capitata]|uniref:(Mediterranean fruit fly) hypothetical protein n=1 Tax=Ceratitis capitata TaxID=7213 RepID=A0A811VFZ9_CERCA|nr:unnamed protein product [Ceratitis capitata]